MTLQMRCDEKTHAMHSAQKTNNQVYDGKQMEFSAYTMYVWLSFEVYILL